MFHKLDEVVAKHREITEELQLPETSANPKRLTELNKQLAYTNLRYMVGSLGESIGTFLCGIMYAIGLRYMFGLSAFFMLTQLTLAYMLVYQRKKLNIK